jgi:prenyltransferase beta subunit
MKSELKKIDNDITGIVSDIPLNELKKIYYKQTYDSKRSLWIDNKPEDFKRKEREIEKFINRMTYEQRIACIQKEAEAFHNTLYDLRVMLRSEAIEGISSLFAYNWLIASMKDDLEAYKATGDDHWIDSALSLCDDILNPFYDKYWNDETVKDISKYLDRMEDAPELTEDDKNRIKTLSDWVRIYGLYKDIKHEEKAINE